MHVVVMGCGRTGSRLATRLDREGHSVAVIDKDRTAFHLLGLEFGGLVVEGIGFDSEVLVNAGIERADVYIAVSSGDNSNIVSSVIAKDVFHVPRVITRIYDPRRAVIYRRFGIPTVAPVSWTVNRISELVFLEHAVARHSFGGGEVELMEFEVPHNLVGRRAGEFEVPGEVRVVVVERYGEAIMAVSGTTFEENDILQVAVSRRSMERFRRMFFMT